MKLRCVVAGLAAVILLALGNKIPAAAVYADNGLETVIGITEGAMTPKRTSVSSGARVTETKLGNFVSDAFRVQSGATVAVECGGHLKQGLPAGEITRNSVSLIFEENLVVGVAEIPIRLFFEVLEHAVSRTEIDEAEKIDPESGFDGFPQVSGFRFTYDISQPAGERIREVTLDDGTKLSPSNDGTIVLALPEDALNGELGFDMLRGTEYAVVGTEAELVAAYIADQPGEIRRPEIGRMQVVGTTDNSIYHTLNMGEYLPYLILMTLIVMLPLRRSRKLHMDRMLPGASSGSRTQKRQK